MNNGREGHVPRGGGGKGKERFQDPNNVSMLSIPKQTKIYVDKLRSEA
jgi:hypothetical protein